MSSQPSMELLTLRRAPLRFCGDDSIDVGARERLITDLASHTQGIEGIAFFDEQHHFVDATAPIRSAFAFVIAEPPRQCCVSVSQ